MAKVAGPIHSTAASGTLGNTIYSRNRYGFYSYEKPVLSPSSSDQQLAIREAFQYCSDQWNSSPYLTQPLRNMWEAFASLYPQKDRFGREFFAKGRHWFISVNLFKRLAGFGLKWDAPIHASCAFTPTVTCYQSASGLFATLSETLSSESLFYCSVISNQSVNRRFIPRIASHGTLWKSGDSSPFLIYPNDSISSSTTRQFIKYKFIDTRGLQSPIQNTFIDAGKLELPASLDITADTFIYSSTPNTNWGSGTDCHCWDNGGEYINSLFCGDFSAITPGWPPVSATLHVYVKSVTVAGTCASYQCLTEWKEMEATYNVRLTGINWGTPGGLTGTDYLIDASDTTYVDTANVFVEFDVTSIVTSWQQGILPNYGIFLRPYSSNCKVSFYTHEDIDPNHHPYLTFTWQ